MHTLLLLVTLLFAAPAWADDYSSTVTLDLSTLTFSGIGVTLTPNSQFMVASVIQNINGPAAPPNYQVSQFEDRGVWVDRSASASLASIGSALAVASPTSFSVTDTLTNTGGTQVILGRVGVLTATQTGTLTISVHYTVALSGAPSSISAAGGPVLLLGDVADGRQRRFASGILNEAGVLSVTQQMNQGQSSSFVIQVSSGRQ